MYNICPFCGHDPFEYVHNGLGFEAVAVTCCEYGGSFFDWRICDPKVDRVGMLLSGDSRRKKRGERLLKKIEKERGLS